MHQTDWEDGTFRVTYSDAYHEFGGGTVNIHVLKTRRRKRAWVVCLADMAPSILKRTGFPLRLVRAAERTAKDKKARIIKRR